MLLTPPDVFSQTLLALPMYALYEIALVDLRSVPARPLASTRTAGPKNNGRPRPAVAHIDGEILR